MAQIKIEKRNMLWPWILVIVILALIIYLIAFLSHKGKEKEDQDSDQLTGLIQYQRPTTSLVSFQNPKYINSLPAAYLVSK
jgi:hypothetical protein